VQHQGNDLGDGKNVWYWIIRSQVLRECVVYNRAFLWMQFID